MELKIKIKETEECDRPLTREEFFAICLDNHPSINIPEANKFLGGLGYVKGSLYCCTTASGEDTTKYGFGIFKTETIRDATDDEINAYHALSIFCKTNPNRCNGCPFDSNPRCVIHSFEWDKIKRSCEGVLEDKEVILEVV